ncbi:MAG: hypothetical protein KU37_06530 [Sulfuricurvum sp. PC08-66]|nr:MAG: hypothetical protein KU37_06530 [Sulfuricurvum sp. PC08-66]
MRTALIWIVSIALVWAVDEIKVVYDLTSGDIKKFETRLLSGIPAMKRHYEAQLKSVEVAVIIHGDAYKFFLKELSGTPYAKDAAFVAKHAELAKRIEALAQSYEVTFAVCSVGTKSRQLDPANFHDVVFIPSASIGLVEYQSQGFGYLPAH